MSLISKGISTIKNDGIKVFVDRTIKYSIVKIKRLVQKKDKANIEKWKYLKDKYKGKRVFIIGNGPSLNITPLYLLKNEYTMAFNRFNLMFERLNWKPDFYVVTDDLVIKDMYNEINNEILPCVQYAFFPDLHPSNVNFKSYIENRENVYWLNTDKSEYRTDLPNCGINKTVINAGMQIAAYLGFTEIYLIGVDMTFEDQKVKKLNSRNWEASEHDPNHFDPRYFGKGRKYHNPTVHEMIEKFETGKHFFNSLGVNVYNAGVGGKLEVFPRKDFSSLFLYDEQYIVDFLSEIMLLKQKELKFDFIIANAIAIKNEQELSALKMVKTDLNTALQLIPKLIDNYLPIGPYKQEYFFIKKQL
ncbi:6-hydroxymethylpterin diphosphokinase MptE-like protein [Parafilimonas sp.]|uniref:6-hydroxymethylpterin diphosphokinase MptE-like protein n=1 Tax=Parafilimonas sp. TaxID=1969739 RepID=UPI0039E25182